ARGRHRTDRRRAIDARVPAARGARARAKLRGVAREQCSMLRRKYVCTPPLRPKHMHEDMWRGLRTHDLQVVSTDHCPFCMKGHKELGKDSFAKIPNGMPDIETRLYLLWDGDVRAGRISMNRFV